MLKPELVWMRNENSKWIACKAYNDICEISQVPYCNMKRDIWSGLEFWVSRFGKCAYGSKDFFFTNSTLNFVDKVKNIFILIYDINITIMDN